jgi:hypothetical protein
MLKKRKDREGIALVVVLGFLAVLTVMAVGMAISMRTERLASRSHIDMVKARLYCSAALADSMVWVEEYLSTTTWTNFLVAPCFREGHEQWAEWYWMLPSRDPISWPGGPDLFKESFFDGIGTNFLPYVPIRYRYELPQSSDDTERINAMGVEWIHVTNKVSGDVEGRYMYMVFDCSAFVDVNYLRREIAPGFTPVGDWDMSTEMDMDMDAFLREREDDVRYESQRDVMDANGELVTSFNVGVGDDWFYFSYFPPMKRIRILRENNINRIEYMDDLAVGGDSAALLELPRDEAGISTEKNNITDAFRAFIERVDGLSAGQSWVDFHTANPVDEPLSMDDMAEHLYELLLDFVDEDFTPEGNNFKRASIEPVPMVNELMISSNIANVELWCPFVGPDDRRFDDSFEIRIEADGVKGSASGLQLDNWSSEVAPPGPKRFQIQLDSVVTNDSFNVEIVVASAEGDLDKVELENLEAGKFAQCNDPRFNHLRSQWLMNTASGTMDAVNQNADYSTPGIYLPDGDNLMYCANRDLDCPGDLGYLPVAPWRTIKLYEDWSKPGIDMDPVLDYFTMQTEVAFGMSNPNVGYTTGRSVSSMLDAFNQLGGGYMACYRDEPELYSQFLFKNFAGLPDSGLDSHKFARGIVFTFTNHGLAMVNPSDFGNILFHFPNAGYNRSILNNFKNRSANWRQNSELRIEHLLRRSSQLASMRQNLFIVCIWSQQLGEPSGGRSDWNSYPVLSEAQAVALVWRDPYPVADADQRHPKFLRFMRWME